MQGTAVSQYLPISAISCDAQTHVVGNTESVSSMCGCDGQKKRLVKPAKTNTRPSLDFAKGTKKAFSSFISHLCSALRAALQVRILRRAGGLLIPQPWYVKGRVWRL